MESSRIYATTGSYKSTKKIVPTAVTQSKGGIYNDDTKQWQVVPDF